MTTKNGLPCDFVISFIQDKEKRWWLYTRCGVVEFSDSELQRWWTNPDAIIQTRVYDTFDGAQPNIAPLSTRRRPLRMGACGFPAELSCRWWIPSRLSQKALPAQTYIESLVADRKEFEATPNLKVPPHPRDLQIDYTSPTFPIPQKVKFRYRLDGYDRDWHDAGTRRQAFYTDLPPGKYSFRVIASNSDGVWNDSAAKLDFSVAPAYYQTNWFRALCAVALSGAAVGGLPVACPAIASSVRDDAGGASRRAHTHCAGASRHSAAKLPRVAAPVPDCFPVAAGAPDRGEGEAGQRDRAGRRCDHRRPGCGAGIARFHNPKQ